MAREQAPPSLALVKPDDGLKQNLLQDLHILREDVEDGRVIEFIGVAFHPGGLYHIVGGGTHDELTMVGILERLKFERLQH